MMHKKISLPVLTESDDCLPHYASEKAAGADLKAFLQEPKVLKAGTSMLIPTGLRVEIPDGYEIQVRPRSGLALKNGITVLNTPGTIDADYRGEIGVILINHSLIDFTVTPGMRIAQMVLAPYYQADFVRADALSSTARGSGGFGHTGTCTKSDGVIQNSALHADAANGHYDKRPCKGSLESEVSYKCTSKAQPS